MIDDFDLENEFDDDVASSAEDAVSSEPPSDGNDDSELNNIVSDVVEDVQTEEAEEVELSSSPLDSDAYVDDFLEKSDISDDPDALDALADMLESGDVETIEDAYALLSIDDPDVLDALADMLESGEAETIEEAYALFSFYDDWDMPEHMAEWSEEQIAAFDALPEEAKAYLSDPSAVVEYVQENVAREMHAQYEPLIQQLEPLMNVLSDPGTSEYLARRESELGISQQDIIRNVLQADAMLTYSANTQQRYEYARQLLQGYGIDPLDLALGNDGSQNYQQQDMQQQLQQERWRREQLERSYHQQQQQQAYSRKQQEVDAFASQTGSDGQPIRPMMNNPAVRASMGHLIASGQAHSLDQAYQMAAAPLEAEIAHRSQYLARQQQQSRQEAVRRSARARPVRVNTASYGGVKSGQSIEDIVGGVVSEMM